MWGWFLSSLWPAKLLMRMCLVSGPEHHGIPQRVWECREESRSAGVAGGEDGSETGPLRTPWQLFHWRLLRCALHHLSPLLQRSLMDWYFCLAYYWIFLICLSLLSCLIKMHCFFPPHYVLYHRCRSISGWEGSCCHLHDPAGWFPGWSPKTVPRVSEPRVTHLSGLLQVWYQIQGETLSVCCFWHI